jgi:hypothetical protein
MRIKHYQKYYLYFIGKVVNITSMNGDRINNVLILDIGINDELIFYQINKENGFRGFFKNYQVQLQETGEEPLFKVSVPKSQETKDEEAD